MSDILIKGMRLPKNCGCCDLCFLSSDNHNFFCTRQVGKRFDVSLSGQRQEGCPLVEVKQVSLARSKDALRLYADGRKVYAELSDSKK